MLKNIHTFKCEQHIFENCVAQAGLRATCKNGEQTFPVVLRTKHWIWEFSSFLIPVILISIYKFNRQPWGKKILTQMPATIPDPDRLEH